MLLSTIENSLNFIFKVTRPRSFPTKITLYWTVITLGPLLLGAAFSVRGYLFTIQKLMPDSFEGVGIYVGKMIPTLITVFVLMAVYILVPNKKVKFFSAFWGAVVCVSLFSVLRLIFAMFVLNSATYKTLYGALAILPVFLVWMYLAWAVVIFGAVVTAALDEFRHSVPQVSEKPQRKFFKKTVDKRTN
jgi:membrane protein